jgi:putative membrane protein
MKFLGGDGVKALEAAVAEIEKTSAVEVVLAVRPRARHWLVQHVVVAIAAGIGVLAFAVWHHLARWEVVALPVIAGVVGLLAVELLGPLYRFLAPGELRDDHVREAARAAFVENRVHATRRRTGLLVFIAVRERRVELVGDTGLDGAPLPDWSKQLAAALPGGPLATAKALASLAPALSTAAPRREDDVNELPDTPLRA